MNKKYWKIPAVIVSSCAVLGISWSGLDYLGIRPFTNGEAAELSLQVASNTTAILLQRWQYLEALRINRGLTVQQRLEYCQISHKLGFKGEGCA